MVRRTTRPLSYPVKEIAISACDYHPLESGHERRLAGDIITVRTPNGFIGKKEAHEYLWLQMEGLDDFSLLKHPNTEPRDDYQEQYGEKNFFEKRRFCIPFYKLNSAYPFFDVSKALDPLILYQPFIVLDEDTFEVLSYRAPMRTEGLVFDKAVGRFL